LDLHIFGQYVYEGKCTSLSNLTASFGIVTLILILYFKSLDISVLEQNNFLFGSAARLEQ